MTRLIRFAWIAGVAALVALIAWAGAEPVARAFAAAGWGCVAVVCLLRAVAVAGAGIGWFVLFPRGLRPAALTCVVVRFVREGGNAFLPFGNVGGNVIGARALILRGVAASLAAASIVVDVLAQAVTQGIFAIAGLATLAAIGAASGVGTTVAIVVACAVPALFGFYALQRPFGRRFVKSVATRMAGERAWASLGAVDALYARLDAIYANRANLLAAAAIHLTFWFVGALEVWAILAFMGLPGGYPEALAIESLTQAIRGAAFAIPGALGVQEGGLIALCAIFGLPPDVAIAMSLIKRVPDVVLGLPSLIYWQVLEGRTFFGGRRIADGTRNP
ncbi:flippase-like domain-containing protein [Roseiarcus fermentans]|nr:flippase-like domain-containing protein [Roseiarcus fermentans]